MWQYRRARENAVQAPPLNGGGGCAKGDTRLFEPPLNGGDSETPAREYCQAPGVRSFRCAVAWWGLFEVGVAGEHGGGILTGAVHQAQDDDVEQEEQGLLEEGAHGLDAGGGLGAGRAF